MNHIRNAFVYPIHCHCLRPFVLLGCSCPAPSQTRSQAPEYAKRPKMANSARIMPQLYFRLLMPYYAGNSAGRMCEGLLTVGDHASPMTPETLTSQTRAIIWSVCELCLPRHTLRAESLSIFLDTSGRGKKTPSAASTFFDLPLIHRNGCVSLVSKTSFFLILAHDQSPCVINISAVCSVCPTCHHCIGF